MFYWFLKIFVAGPLLKVLYRPWVEGAENEPETGGALMASNHLSFSDSFFLPIVLKRRITFPAKMEYFTGRGVKGRLTAAFFKGVGQIPIDRSGGAASEAAIKSGLRVLRRGDLFGIYPEGTRSPDGRLYKGKTGIARMALEAGCPVVPVAMVGTDKAQPAGKKVPKIMRIGVRIGKPLDFSRYEGMEHDRFVLRSITDEIMYELMLLSGQEYVDVYATSVKKNVLKDTVQNARDTMQNARDTMQNARDTMQTAVDSAVETVHAKAREIQAAAAAAAAAARAAAAERTGSTDSADDTESADSTDDAPAVTGPGAGTGEPADHTEDGESGLDGDNVRRAS
ncbi:MAG: 1-acyl-sn-glycerol-3-phosphate acyltransferase [Actinomycetales bacterium]|nr:MAG: 1-acyl-sn-glycerol-3-phosphate acyltransferase [Actinomycetales bacterium]